MRKYGFKIHIASCMKAEGCRLNCFNGGRREGDKGKNGMDE
jgi:hypothetical protein